MKNRIALLPSAVAIAIVLMNGRVVAQQAGQTTIAADPNGLRGSLGPDVGLPAGATNSAAQREQRELRAETQKAKAGSEGPDPWAPLGIRAGGFILYPSVEVTAGETSNAGHSSGGGASATSSVTPKLVIQSDWSRHEATLTLRGTDTKYYDGTTLPDQTAAAEATARIDISRDWQGDLNAGYFLTHQTPSETGFPSGADDKPAVHTLDAGAELKRAIGPATVSLIGTSERTVYDPAHSGGVPIDQGDRDNTIWETRLRLSYEVTPITAPFIEIGGGRRVFDRLTDVSGFQRSATTAVLRGGIAYDSSPVLKAELGVGYRLERRDDPLLPDLAGLTLDGSLSWSPTRLTTFDFHLTTAFNPTANPTSAGSIVYDGTADFAYDFRRNIVVHALGEVSAEHFDNGGVNYTYTVGGGFDWKLNRMLVLNTRYSHAWTSFANPAGDFTADSVIAGITAQK